MCPKAVFDLLKGDDKGLEAIPSRSKHKYFPKICMISTSTGNPSIFLG